MTTADNKTIIKTNRCVACAELFNSYSKIVNHHIQGIQVSVHEKCYEEIYNTDKYPPLKPSADGILSRIYSHKKRQEVLDVLEASNTPHFRRVWMAAYLKYAIELSNEEIFVIIEEKNKWRHKDGRLKFDPTITKFQVASIRKASARELAARTIPSLERQPKVAGASPRFPCFTIPEGAETVDTGDGWIGIKSGCGYVLDWIRKSLITEVTE